MSNSGKLSFINGDLEGGGTPVPAIEARWFARGSEKRKKQGETAKRRKKTGKKRRRARPPIEKLLLQAGVP